jgi:lactoylglutathione lyase
MRVHYVIITVSDMQRSVSFYRDVLGLPLRFESPGWTEFATEGATVALHGAGSHEQRSTSSSLNAGCCRPGFNVPDLDAFHEKMVQQGVQCIEATREVFGSRVAQYADPDGLAFSVGEERNG